MRQNTLPIRTYASWKTQMEAFLLSIGSLQIHYRKSENSVSKDLEKYEFLLEDGEKALKYVKRNFEPLQLDLIAVCTTALGAWEKLESFYIGDETFNEINLLQSLVDGSLKETEIKSLCRKRTT